MNRRIVLGAGVVAAAATAGWIALPSGKHPLTIAAATDALARLRGTKINHAGGWNPAQVFAHLAQSIEYSMTGFPQPKSALFQSTVGAAAFAEAYPALKASVLTWGDYGKLTLPGLLSGVVLTFVPSMGLFFIADILGGNKVVLVAVISAACWGKCLAAQHPGIPLAAALATYSPRPALARINLAACSPKCCPACSTA